ncbi:GIY-YIG nuclease family protein [Bacteroidota bacterium]
MKYYVYIPQSLKDNTLYKGYTTDIERRLNEHNSGKSRYTKNKIPWKLIYLEECIDKTSALKREKSLKRANSKYLIWLIEQPTNLLNK